MEFRRVHISTVNSTNSYSKTLLKRENVLENTIVIADYQVAGRGQGKNLWHSEKSKNLLFSWIAFPAFLAVSDQFMLSKAVSLALIDMLLELGLPAFIKWPNDIICNDKKLAGILIENTIQGGEMKNSVIGVGLNVNQTVFPDFPIPATSIALELKNEISVAEVLDRLLKFLISRYNQQNGIERPLIDKDYQEKLYRRNMPGTFQSDEDKFTGKIVGVNNVGELRIERSGKVRDYGFHSIKMII